MNDIRHEMHKLVMDLKNIKSWQIAAVSITPFIIRNLGIWMKMSVTNGDEAVFLAFLIMFSLIFLGISLIPMLCLKSENQKIKKFGAVVGVIFGLLGLYLIPDISHTFLIDYLTISVWSLSLLLAGIYYFWKEAPKKNIAYKA